MKQHKIIHMVVGRADHNTSNGVNRWVHNVATIQKKQGYDIEVWGITKNTHLTKHEHIYPLQLFKPMKFPFGNDKKLIYKLKTIPKNTIFHLHSVFIFEFYLFSRNLKKYGFKWVLSPHGGYASKENILLKLIYKKLFENKIIKEASAIHAISFNDIDEISKKKFGMAYNGVQFNSNFKTIYSKDLSLRINYCGRLAIKHKGLDLLLKATYLFKKQEKNIYLDLVGDGPDKTLLKKKIESLNLTNNVSFYGNKFGTEKDEIIKKSDLFIHCSRWEAMPLAILEAASLAVPLLVSKPTNLAEHVLKFKAGFVIDELTPNNISEMFQVVYEEKIIGQLENKGKAARKMVIENFSWEKTVELLNKNVYSKIKFI